MCKIVQKLVFLVSVFALDSVNSLLDAHLEKLDDKLLITLLNPARTYRGERLFEGDLVINPQEPLLEEDAVGWKALPNKGGMWMNKIIPYEFHESVNDGAVNTIKEAMTNWEGKTCLKFVPRTNEQSFLRFRSDSEGCYTYVGRKDIVGQDVNLGEGCQHLQIAMHEIGHSLGFFHEHSRKDRSPHLKILWQNIQRGMTSQFNTGNDNPRGVAYDVTSIMHYSPMSFSGKIFQKNTMASVNPHLQPLIGKFKGITFRDAKLANQLYKCNDHCLNRNSANCRNEGYLGFATDGAGNCRCVCPPNTKGAQCQDLIGSYYGAPICGGDISSEKTISTPIYPKRKRDDSCTWKITAPSGKKVSVQFLDFSFRPRIVDSKSPYHGLCLYEHVEIRTGGGDDGEMYCGTDFEQGSRIVSSSNILWILIKASNQVEGRGLKAKISFV